MRSLAPRAARRFGLATTEAAYLGEVEANLRRLPATVRRRVVDEAAGLLSERPPAPDRETLVEEVGWAFDLAASLQAAAGLSGSMTWWDRWLLHSRRARVARIAAPVLVGAVLLWAYSWFTAVPDISNSCGGVTAADVEWVTAASHTEYTAPFVENGRYGLSLCLQSDDPGVEIVAISVPPGGPLRQVGVELSTARRGRMVGDASTFEPYRPADYPWLADLIVWLEMEYCNGSGRSGLDTVDLSYRYRGRVRTMEFPLGNRASVAFGEQCIDEVREQSDREEYAWSAVTGTGTFNEGWEGPLGLWPVDISRDLCRYLEGPVPSAPHLDQFEPLGARAVFQLDDLELSEILIDGAVLGICPEFADRRGELVSLAVDVAESGAD